MSNKVGWREWVALPTLGIKALKCKVDTGAKSSALHAFDLQSFEKNGQAWVRFSMHTDELDSNKVQTIEAPVVDSRVVTDSSGNQSERFFIQTQLNIGGHTIISELSLTNRDTMKYNMLLGRVDLRQCGFMVDPSQSYLQGKNL